MNFNESWKVATIQNSREMFLWCFLAAGLLFFTAAPSFILSGLKMQNVATDIRLAFWKKMSLGVLGGIIGEVMAIAMYCPAESSWCRDMSAQGSYCDGQGPMVLIFAIPLCAIVGSCASMLWTWYSLSIQANHPWASVFSYCGGSRTVNVRFAIAIQTVYWATFAFAVYLWTRNLL